MTLPATDQSTADAGKSTADAGKSTADAGKSTADAGHDRRRGSDRAPRVPFAVLILALLGGGLCALLALNTATAASELRERSVDADNTSLTDQEQQLSRDLASLQAPEALATRAAALGMVPVGSPAFLRINADGSVTVLGAPAAATYPPAPAPAVSPKPTAPKPAATATKTPTKAPTKPGSTASGSPGAATASAASAQPSLKPNVKPTPTRTPTPTVTLPGGPR